MRELKIVCWIGDSPNHKALVSRISREFNISGIVIDRRRPGFPVHLSKFIRKIINKMRHDKIDRVWHALLNHYAFNFAFPSEIETLVTDSINNPGVLNFTKKHQPDLVVVSGTNLVKPPLVSMAFPIGIINLHTGLSPYVKGGPNCTNWCIANNNWSLIGNTVLWLSEGIDSGNIITSEKTNISDAKSFYDIHITVMEHAHDLVLRALRYITKTKPPYQSVPQTRIGKGTLYLNKMWTQQKKKQLAINLNGNRDLSQPNHIVTVPIPY